MGLLYQPAFVADDGSGMKLEVDAETLLYNKARGEYISPNGLGYNPQHTFFGGSYTLKTKQGIQYEIDANSGDLLTATESNGNQLTFTDAGIFSNTGAAITFERDAQGRITAAIDPMGHKVKYEYDAKGDLVKVTDPENNETELFYEESSRPHYLTRIEDPLNRSAVRTEYLPNGRLKKIFDVDGDPVEFEYDLNSSTQIIKDALGNPTLYEYDIAIPNCLKYFSADRALLCMAFSARTDHNLFGIAIVMGMSFVRSMFWDMKPG